MINKRENLLFHYILICRVEGKKDCMRGDCDHVYGCELQRSKNHYMRGDCSELWGDCSSLRGDCTGLRGRCSELSGDCSGLRGDCSGLSGDCTYLSGNCSNLKGDCTGLRGICTGLLGDFDLCEITEDERKKGVHIHDLIFKMEEEK
jgi:hypothetical protein